MLEEFTEEEIKKIESVKTVEQLHDVLIEVQVWNKVYEPCVDGVVCKKVQELMTKYETEVRKFIELCCDLILFCSNVNCPEKDTCNRKNTKIRGKCKEFREFRERRWKEVLGVEKEE